MSADSSSLSLSRTCIALASQILKVSSTLDMGASFPRAAVAWRRSTHHFSVSFFCQGYDSESVFIVVPRVFAMFWSVFGAVGLESNYLQWPL